ncbi:Bifunctional inhibitor/plant lipid transfer protein/seed storage helical domain [Macleaya cordata]|uniref:Bifunctional inhibitor/plant lipid transfer protein/seed storage helical domain n=1 Tax=Macleaya cordata TaxID=56857 RepID=A0A200QFW3_MACCD|nr:Bifunctional inhibitor/plant lipid transfer protein/seed storage helical domain [Macleaya cordata]
MGSAKFFLSVILLFSSWVFLGFSQLEGIIGALGGGMGGGGGGGMECAQKLLPCQAYLKPPSSPPDTCCVPLKQMITDDVKCLCGIFNNQDLLKTFHVTQEEALKLLGECGAKADISQCNNAGGGGN